MSRYYVGLDVHKASIRIAVLDQEWKLLVESVVETSAATVLTFLGGLRGHVEVTFEESTHAVWLYDVLRAARVKTLVCDPRKNKLLLEGNKSDKTDARKPAQLLRAGLLSPVYHGEAAGGRRPARGLATELDGAGWSGKLLHRPAWKKFFLTAPFIERNRKDLRRVDAAISLYSGVHAPHSPQAMPAGAKAALRVLRGAL